MASKSPRAAHLRGGPMSVFAQNSARTATAKARRADFASDVLNAMERLDLGPSGTRKTDEWAIDMLARNHRDEDVERWACAEYRFGQQFREHANLLRWALLYLRRDRHGEQRALLESDTLTQRIQDRLRTFTAAHYDKLRSLLRQAQAGKERVEACSPPQPVAGARVVSKAMLDGFLGSRNTPLPDDTVYAATLVLIEAGLLRVPDAQEGVHDLDALRDLHRALNRFLEVAGPSGRDFAAAALGYELRVGHFLLYRPSQHAPGFYVRGLVTLSNQVAGPGDEDHALVVEEIYLYDSSSSGGVAFMERYRGVMSKKAGSPFMLTCRQTKRDRDDSTSRDDSRGAPRFSLFPQTVYSNRYGVVSMTGITVSPFAGGHAYALPVCLERTLLPQQLGLDGLRGDPFEQFILENQLGLGVFAAERYDMVPLEIQARLRRTQETDTPSQWGVMPIGPAKRTQT